MATQAIPDNPQGWTFDPRRLQCVVFGPETDNSLHVVSVMNHELQVQRRRLKRLCRIGSDVAWNFCSGPAISPGGGLEVANPVGGETVPKTVPNCVLPDNLQTRLGLLLAYYGRKWYMPLEIGRKNARFRPSAHYEIRLSAGETHCVPPLRHGPRPFLAGTPDGSAPRHASPIA